MAVELGSTTLFNDANLVSYYKLENVNDSKGSNNLTNNGTTTFAAGKFNNAADFGSSNSSKSLTLAAGSTFFTGTGSKAFSFWVNPSAQPGSGAQWAMASWGNASHRIIFRYQDTGGTKEIGLGDGATNITVGTQTLSNGTWYHLAFSLTGTTFTTWVNGTQLGTNTVSLAAPANGFGIGIQQNEGANWFSGLIDDFAIFSRALTQTDVDLLYNGPATAGAFFNFFNL